MKHKYTVVGSKQRLLPILNNMQQTQATLLYVNHIFPFSRRGFYFRLLLEKVYKTRNHIVYLYYLQNSRARQKFEIELLDYPRD